MVAVPKVVAAKAMIQGATCYAGYNLYDPSHNSQTFSSCGCIFCCLVAATRGFPVVTKNYL